MPPSKEPSANGRSSKQAKQDEDIVMVDAGGPSENVKRSESTKKAAGLGGMFGGLLSKPRTEMKRRATVDEDVRGLRREDRKIKRPSRDRTETENADVTMTGGVTEEDAEAAEARRAARRARRAEKEALDKAAEDSRRAKDVERRERRRKQEEEAEARRQEEKEIRRAARREQKAAEDAERQAAEAKAAERAERHRAKRAERDAREATHTDGEPLTEGPERLKRSDRRKLRMDGPEDDEERRRRREERRAARGTDTPKTSRRRSAPIMDSYFDSRNGSKARDTEPVKESRRKKAGWPHSGTDSWVADHSDAPPPPDNGGVEGAGDETAGDEGERRRMRKTRRHTKYDGETEEDPEERRKRRESRRRERDVKSSEGSQPDGRRSSRRESGFIEPRSRAPSATKEGGGIFSRWKKMI